MGNDEDARLLREAFGVPKQDPRKMAEALATPRRAMSDKAKVEPLPEGTRFRHRRPGGLFEVKVGATRDTHYQSYRWRRPEVRTDVWSPSVASRAQLRAWYEVREPEAALSAFEALPVTEGADELIDAMAREAVLKAKEGPAGVDASDLLATFDAPVTPEALEFSVLSKPPATSSYEATADKMGALAARAVSREVDEARTWDDLVERVDGSKADWLATPDMDAIEDLEAHFRTPGRTWSRSGFDRVNIGGAIELTVFSSDFKAPEFVRRYTSSKKGEWTQVHPPPGAVEALAHRVEFGETLRMWVGDTASPSPLAMLPSGDGER